jgi:hypothetical protein
VSVRVVPEARVRPAEAVRSWVEVRAPFTVVVCPVRPIETEVAFVPPIEMVLAPSISTTPLPDIVVSLKVKAAETE